MKLPSCLLSTWIALAGLQFQAVAAAAQTHWTIEGNSSLAWFQIVPHLNHLWSTTCPGDPGWRPGEGRNSGWYINPALPQLSYADTPDTVHVPVYPRYRVRHLCAEAVHGDVTVADTAHWRGVRGSVAVRADALVTGESWRDETLHNLVLQTQRFPEVVFTIDSVVGLSRVADTLVGRAVGTFTVKGVATPTIAEVKALPDSGGMRVLARWRIPADDIMKISPSLHTIGLGLNLKIWKYLYMGADFVMRPVGNAASSTRRYDADVGF
jgi:hypothetical protein